MTGSEIRRLTTEIQADLSELAKVKLGAAYADFVRDVGEFLHFLEAMAEE